MNIFTKLAMTAYYMGVELLLKLSGYRRERVFSIAGLLGLLRYHIGYVGRDKSKKLFLREISKVFPGKRIEKVKLILKDFWVMHQKSFLDFFMAYRLKGEDCEKYFEFEGTDSLDSALEEGKGAILTTFHFGDGRILHIGLSLKGYPVNILSSRYDEYSRFGREVRLRTSRKFHEVFYEGRSMRWMYRSLSKNKVVFMSITGFAGNKGLFFDCLGSKVYVSTAPVRLALKTGAPIIPAVALREEGGNVKILVRESLHLERTGEFGKDLEVNTGKLIKILEDFVHDYPGQHDWRVWFIRIMEAENLYRKKVQND